MGFHDDTDTSTFSSDPRGMRERSALGELLDVDYASMSLMRLYRVSDILLWNQETLENKLFSRRRDFLGLECTSWCTPPSAYKREQ
jgi:hypothetical protein